MVCWYYYYSCNVNRCLLIYYPPEDIKDCTPTLRTAAAQSGGSGGSPSNYNAATIVVPLAIVVIIILAVVITMILLYVYFFKKKKIFKDTDLTQWEKTHMIILLETCCFFLNRGYLNADTIILENQFPLGKIKTLVCFLICKFKLTFSCPTRYVFFTFSSTKGVSSAATTSYRAQG